MSDITINMSHIKESIASHKGGYMVLWTYQYLKIIGLNGELEDSILNSVHEKDIVRVRIFNEESEHHYWRSGQQLKRRTQIEYPEMKIERKMIMKGSVAKQLEGVIETGINDRIAVKTYHYYQPNEIGQVGYVDMRFVNFEKA